MYKWLIFGGMAVIVGAGIVAGASVKEIVGMLVFYCGAGFIVYGIIKVIYKFIRW